MAMVATATASRRVQAERERRQLLRFEGEKRRTNVARPQPAGSDLHPVVKRSHAIQVEEFSPRLAKVEPNENNGAPLLPPPPLKDSDDGPEDRFCTAGPTMEGVGIQRSTLGDTKAMTFAELAARLESAMGQASLLLNDRLRSLQHRCVGQGAKLTEVQNTELCEIADGIAGATYHVSKWAHALQKTVGAAAGTQVPKPNKPGHCSGAEEAFASVRYQLPRLTVNAAEAHKGLAAARKLHGEDAEKKVRSLGVPIEDLRALTPHLERLIMRLGRLGSSVKPGPSVRQFIPNYFAPVIGRKAAQHILPFLW